MTPITTLKAIPGLIWGVAMVTYSSNWRRDAPEMFIQFGGWLAVTICGGVMIGSLLWQLFRWHASRRERAKAMHALCSQSGQRPNLFQSQWFTNGVILIGIGLALLGLVEMVLRHNHEWMIFDFLRFLSVMINWSILKTIFFSGLIMTVLGAVCITIPFLIRLKQQLESLASRNDKFGEIVSKLLP